MRRGTWRAAAFVVVLAGLAGTGACGGPRPDQAGDDRLLDARFARRFAVGGTADTSLMLRLLFATGVGTDDLGHLFVLNSDDRYVAVYDTTGRLIRRIGRRGKGPGEFESAFRITVDPGGTFRVHDDARRAAVGFFISGRVGPERSVAGRGFAGNLYVDDDGTMISRRERGDTAVLIRYTRFATDTVAVLALPPPRPIDASRCGLAPGSTDRPVFSPTLPWTVRAGLLAYISDHAFAVRFVDYSGLPRVLRRNRNPRTASATLAALALPGGWQVTVGMRNPCSIPADDAVRQLGFNATIPAYSGVVIDQLSRIWAMRWPIAGEPRRADIFGTRTGYIGTIALGELRPVAFLSNGDLVSLERDEQDAPVVVAYAVTGMETARRF